MIGPTIHGSSYEYNPAVQGTSQNQLPDFEKFTKSDLPQEGSKVYVFQNVPVMIRVPGHELITPADKGLVEANLRSNKLLDHTINVVIDKNNAEISGNILWKMGPAPGGMVNNGLGIPTEETPAASKRQRTTINSILNAKEKLTTMGYTVSPIRIQEFARPRDFLVPPREPRKPTGNPDEASQNKYQADLANWKDKFQQWEKETKPNNLIEYSNHINDVLQLANQHNCHIVIGQKEIKNQSDIPEDIEAFIKEIGGEDTEVLTIVPNTSSYTPVNERLNGCKKINTQNSQLGKLGENEYALNAHLPDMKFGYTRNETTQRAVTTTDNKNADAIQKQDIHNNRTKEMGSDIIKLLKNIKGNNQDGFTLNIAGDLNMIEGEEAYSLNHDGKGTINIEHHQLTVLTKMLENAGVKVTHDQLGPCINSGNKNENLGPQIQSVNHRIIISVPKDWKPST